MFRLVFHFDRTMTTVSRHTHGTLSDAAARDPGSREWRRSDGELTPSLSPAHRYIFAEEPAAGSKGRDHLDHGGKAAAATGGSSSSRESWTESVVEIPSSERRDAALFTCVAVNQFGRDTRNIQLLVQGTTPSP